MILYYLALIVLFVWFLFELCRITNSGWKILNGESAEWKVRSSCLVIMIILAVLELIGAVVEIVSFPTGAVILASLLNVVTFILAIAVLMAIRKQEQ